MKTLLCVLAAAIALIGAPDTNVSGKWSGTFVITNGAGETNNSTAFLVLKQTGADITGTVGPNEDEQHQIKKGTIAGEKITLLVEEEGRVINFDLVLASDHIKGDVKMSRDGETRNAKIDVERAK